MSGESKILKKQLARAIERIGKLEEAGNSVISAYHSRFESGIGNYFGPIDDEIKALCSALQNASKQGNS